MKPIYFIIYIITIQMMRPYDKHCHSKRQANSMRLSAAVEATCLKAGRLCLSQKKISRLDRVPVLYSAIT